MTRSEQFERNIRNFSHTFQDSIGLLEGYITSQPNSPEISIKQARSQRNSLVQRMEIQYQLSKGYFKQYQYLTQVQALEAAEDILQHAEKCQIATLIYASAARKANRNNNWGVLNQMIERKILHIREVILGHPSNDGRLEELQQFIDLAESRSWQRCDGENRLITFIGATWCPDTVNVVEIMECFSIPMHILIMDEDNANEEGYLKFNEHALMLIKPDPNQDRLRVPVMIFPDSSRMIEPKPREFMIELVKQKII